MIRLNNQKIFLGLVIVVLLLMPMPGNCEEAVFNYVKRDVDLDGKPDFIEITNHHLIMEIDLSRGTISKYFLQDRKFNTELVPQLQGEVETGMGLIKVDGELAGFSLESADANAARIAVTLDSEKLKRKYMFYPGTYMFEQIFELKGNHVIELCYGPYVESATNSFAAWFDEKLNKVNFSKSLKSAVPSKVKFVALLSSYYNLTIVPESGKLSLARILPATVEKAVMTEGVNLWMEFRNQETVSFKHFFGPNDRELLAEAGAEELISYGFFSSIAQALLSALRFFNGFTHNWGLAIILLTIMIKIILHPLTVKQTKSMEEMRKIQPIVNNLRERYKNDPQKLNAETMKVYKDHNINPLGGCLPVLIQLPVLFALFTVLRVSIDLKGESFLWIPDLALPDATLFLPIMVALTMFYQQKNMPNADPQQKGMMYFMPILMLFFARALASGVVLYWFVSTLLGAIEQQMVARRYSSPAKINGKGEKRK